jgi:hypothetical protein
MAAAINRQGPVSLQAYPVDSATAITAGDMLFLDTDDVKPASSFAWDTNIATTQAGFAAVYVGVAVNDHAANSGAGSMSVDTSSSSVWEFDQAADAVVTGGMLGPAKASGDALENQKVAEAASTSAIFRCYLGVPSTATRVQVTQAPARTTASSNVNANIG